AAESRHPDVCTVESETCRRVAGGEGAEYNAVNGPELGHFVERTVCNPNVLAVERRAESVARESEGRVSRSQKIPAKQRDQCWIVKRSRQTPGSDWASITLVTFVALIAGSALRSCRSLRSGWPLWSFGSLLALWTLWTSVTIQRYD